MAKYYENKTKKKNPVASPSAQKGEYSMEHAGMPQEKVMREYPKADYSGPMGMDDSREGIDRLAKDNASQMMKKPGGRYNKYRG